MLQFGPRRVQAGRGLLTLDEILRLHGVLIHAGLQPDGAFLRERDDQGDPLPEFIGARPEDLDGLMAGMPRPMTG